MKAKMLVGMITSVRHEDTEPLDLPPGGQTSWAITKLKMLSDCRSASSLCRYSGEGKSWSQSSENQTGIRVQA